MKGLLPHLEMRSFVYSANYETVRRSEVVDNLERYRSEGDLPRLWAGVRRAKLDVALSESPAIIDMANVLSRATKQKLICENVARRAAKWEFTVKDVKVLEKSFKELDSLGLGPKLWKDPMYPLLPKVEALRPHMETLRDLAQEYRFGSERYCPAWLETIQRGRLSAFFDLEVSTARWFLAFPDAAEQLGRMVSEEIQQEFWRLSESISDGATWKPEEINSHGTLAPKDAHLAKILVFAGQMKVEI